MRNKFVFIIITLLFVLSMFELGFSKSRWVKDGDKWKYEIREGSGNYVTERWREIADNGIDGKVYYFDYYGHMVTGPVLINGALYVYADTGEAITTGYDIDGVHYATDGRGKVLGLPMFFDLSRFAPVMSSTSAMVANNSQVTIYDDNSAVMPTAAAQ